MQSPCYRLSNLLSFEPLKQQLYDENGEVVQTLGNNEAKALMILIDRRDQIVTRERLQEEVWRKQGLEVDDSSITQAISNLRKLLNDDSKTPQFIRTVPKKGYIYIGDATPISFEQLGAVNSKRLNLPLWQWGMWAMSTCMIIAAISFVFVPKPDFRLPEFQKVEFEGINYYASGVKPDDFLDNISEIADCTDSYRQQLKLQDSKNVVIFRRGNNISLSLIDPRDSSAGRPNRSTNIYFKNLEAWDIGC
ncbi:hypothetical protein DBZ36_08770 [Alginatibacterium sediminis]|uniref:OmpR/PhoB-type domain-containing protein n=1 Tax=Alginatibacterium sediminis TaxID=2164068 RepID=A0A420ECY9_9ALTE|nr:winged helix-turn-helix domain-containing protein [Alginatibacterium sediminis]RKF18492.1 hypothetical protein DBZ36_08770 [Alginatibacterium sediminis]